MYSFELIQTYMKAKNYTQAKQAALDLGYSEGFVSKVKDGKKNISEESAIYIAERCGLDVNEVLIKLQAEKAKSDTEKSAWLAMLKKYNHGINSINSVTLAGLLALIPHKIDFALYYLLLNANFLIKSLKIVCFENQNAKQTHTN